MKRKISILIGLYLLIGAASSRPVCACGGLWDPGNNIAQNAQRIIIADNGDGTLTTIVQLQYDGDPEDFAWVLPLPVPIPAEAIQVPETADDTFLILEQQTNPEIIPPPAPFCAEGLNLSFPFLVGGAAPGEEAGVNLFSSGSVGPFSFDVIGADDSNALFTWLIGNGYPVTAAQEPILNAYIKEGFVFLAMRLQPEAGADTIRPVQITFPADRPMIPLRMSAVAAQPDTSILVWFFSDVQVIPTNYEAIQVADDEITFFNDNRFDPFNSNYESVVSNKFDEFGGQAFITDYAGSSTLRGSNPILTDLAARHPYLTRLRAELSPEEMTLDPTFAFDATLPDVPRVRDMRQVKDGYACQRDWTVAPGLILLQYGFWSCLLLCPMSLLVLVVVLRRRRRRGTAVSPP